MSPTVSPDGCLGGSIVAQFVKSSRGPSRDARAARRPRLRRSPLARGRRGDPRAGSGTRPREGLCPTLRGPLARRGGRPHVRERAVPLARSRPATRSSSAPAASHSRRRSPASSRSIAACVIRSRSSCPANGTARSAPRSKSSFWTRSRPPARPSERVELVDVPQRGHARVELRDPRAVAEARLPLVAAARVDARQADGLVALTHPRSLRR